MTLLLLGTVAVIVTLAAVIHRRVARWDREAPLGTVDGHRRAYYKDDHS